MKNLVQGLVIGILLLITGGAIYVSNNLPNKQRKGSGHG